MAKQKVKIVHIGIAPSTFSYIFRRLRKDSHDYEFSALSEFRSILSNEKAKMLYIIKNSHPDSIYQLAKLLDRDFKSVRKDVKLLERTGFVELKKEQKGNRTKLKPLIKVDSLNVIFEV